MGCLPAIYADRVILILLCNKQFEMAANVAMSESMVFSPRPAAMRAKRIRSVYVPQSGGQNQAPGSVIRINIPTAPNNYLLTGNTSLKFTVTTDQVSNLDGSAGAASFFSKIVIYHGSNQLESISGLARLTSCLNDCTRTPNEMQSVGSITQGQPGADPTPIDGVTVTDDDGDAVLLAQVAEVEELVEELANIRDAVIDGDDAGTYTYQVPILSGIVGTLCPKALPLSAMTAADIRIELTLAQKEDALQSSEAALEWTASNFELHCDLLQLDPASEAMVVSAAGGQFSVGTQSYSQATSVVAESANSASVLLPFRYSSLKSILLGHYQQSIARNFADKFTARSRASLQSYFFRIGSSHVPANPVELGTAATVPCEAFVQLMSAFHVSVGNIQFGNMMNISSYNTNQGRTSMGKFLIGLELESFQKGSSDRVESGTNTLSSQVFAELRYGGDGTPAAEDINSWAYHDVLLTMTGGVCRATI